MRQLVQKAQAGDREAFNALTRECHAKLKASTLHLLGDRPGALYLDDVLQDTYLRAFERIGRFQWQGEDSFTRWLGAIARNVVREVTRKTRRVRLIGLESDLQGSDVTQSRASRRRERLERLQEALSQLGPQERQVVLLARLEGVPLKDVAVRLNRSHGAVRQILWRALKNLKQNFGDTESLHLPKDSSPAYGESRDDP